MECRKLIFRKKVTGRSFGINRALRKAAAGARERLKNSSHSSLFSLTYDRQDTIFNHMSNPAPHPALHIAAILRWVSAFFAALIGLRRLFDREGAAAADLLRQYIIETLQRLEDVLQNTAAIEQSAECEMRPIRQRKAPRARIAPDAAPHWRVSTDRDVDGAAQDTPGVRMTSPGDWRPTIHAKPPAARRPCYQPRRIAPRRPPRCHGNSPHGRKHAGFVPISN
ncbi:MAG: hypothetical protein NT133_16750 [Alphaproteobacteria bacterium]|nr:hypothetical protein [Alphaproteobacteria bacterium]